MICSDNQTTRNFRKIHHVGCSSEQYCSTNYENTSNTVHSRHCDLLYIIRTDSIVITISGTNLLIVNPLMTKLAFSLTR